MKHILAALTMAALMAGCMNYKYEGETAERMVDDPADIIVTNNRDKLGEKYVTLGKAELRADYDNTATDKMMNRLRDEAAKAGANVILITERQVVPSSSTVQRPDYEGSFGTASSAGSLNQMMHNIDQDYVKPADRGKTFNSYDRIIRAEFIRLE